MHMITRSGVLLLWSQLMTFVTCHDCTLEQFKKSRHFDLNFDISGLQATYSGGKQVTVPCNPGYTGFFKMICSEGRWLSSSPKCELKSCGHPGNAQFADFLLVVGDDYVVGSEIVYVCNPGYHMVSRSSHRRCLPEGWDGNIPVCEAPANCSAPPPLEDGDTKLLINSAAVYQTGDRIEYLCQYMYIMDGDPFKTCDNGVWKGDMRCLLNSCEIRGLTPNLYLSGLTPTGGTMEPGHKLRFLCGPGYQLDGSTEIECLPTGQWSASFPSCSAAVHCSAPPPLEDGDVKSFISSATVYQTGDRVEYICVDMYTMDGDPFKTCDNGVWKGDMRCLKPCTVNEELMRQHGIIFRHVSDNKLYAPHEDHITFRCVSGKRPVGNVPFRVQCNDGQMTLPTCQ